MINGRRSFKYADLVYPISALVMVGLIVGGFAVSFLFVGDAVNAASVRNATGREIYVLHASDHEQRNELPMHAKWSWPWQWRVAIANGGTSELIYDVFHPWIVEIDDGRCLSWYRVPQFREGSEILTVTEVRLAPDNLLYADLSEFVLLRKPPDWQPQGYPVRPFEQRCKTQ